MTVQPTPTTPVHAKSGFYISLRVKLLVGFTLLFSVVFSAAYYWFYTFATQLAFQRIAEDLKDTLEGTSKGIDGDELRALYSNGQCPDQTGDGCYPDDARYLSQVQWLAKAQNVEPRASAYTYIKGEGPKELIFITSGGAVADPPFGAKFLEHYTANNPDPNYRGLERTTLELEPYTDDFGYWVSGYTPIYDTQGQVVAALGIDFKAEYVLEVQQAIRDQVVVAFVITYGVLFILVYAISAGLTTPITALTKAAERIGEGDYEQDLSHLARTRFPDEINTMARVFEIMVAKVYTREQTLIKQVAELKIEIDEAKRLKQVSDLTDNEFFRELQTKSRAMRRRRTSSGEEEESEPKEPDQGTEQTETGSAQP